MAWRNRLPVAVQIVIRTRRRGICRVVHKSLKALGTMWSGNSTEGWQEGKLWEDRHLKHSTRSVDPHKVQYSASTYYHCGSCSFMFPSLLASAQVELACGVLSCPIFVVHISAVIGDKSGSCSRRRSSVATTEPKHTRRSASINIHEI